MEALSGLNEALESQGSERGAQLKGWSVGTGSSAVLKMMWEASFALLLPRTIKVMLNAWVEAFQKTAWVGAFEDFDDQSRAEVDSKGKAEDWRSTSGVR